MPCYDISLRRCRWLDRAEPFINIYLMPLRLFIDLFIDIDAAIDAAASHDAIDIFASDATPAPLRYY